MIQNIPSLLWQYHTSHLIFFICVKINIWILITVNYIYEYLLLFFNTTQTDYKLDKTIFNQKLFASIGKIACFVDQEHRSSLELSQFYGWLPLEDKFNHLSSLLPSLLTYHKLSAIIFQTLPIILNIWEETIIFLVY